MQRYETLEIPKEALREILYNAIAHKNYMGPVILMHVYDDKIELWNDGNLPEGFNEEILYGSHPSIPRNPNIAKAMFMAGFIDTWGRGYKKIYEGFEKNGLPIPKVHDFLSGTQVVIERTVFQKLNLLGRNNVGRNVGENVGENVGRNVGRNIEEISKKYRRKYRKKCRKKN